MIEQLIDVFDEESPSDRQHLCVSAFCNRDFWKEVGIEDDGTDAAFDRQIRYLINNYAMPKYIRNMLLDWQEEGF